ncbi:DUF4386 domain-containing protein [Millisia brevis]|uniref:DUF4386 domain-containing protein n=1 Tax=Millisia brevis TaxID=264148 RepID=UPI000831C9AD|nr:DUF4386 domain-containing protein [Millisia brevis]
MAHSSRQHARAAGILYLVTHVTSVTAVAAYTSGAVIAGVTLEFALAIGCAGTGVLLWILLREFGPARAATFGMLRAVEAAVILAGTLPLLASTRPGLSDGSTAATGLHDAAFLVGQGLVISVNTIVLGWLLIDAGVVPRALAVLGPVGGTLVLAGNLAQLWGAIPQGGAIAALAAIPVFAFEIWLAVYLIAVGFRRRESETPARPIGVGA